MGDASPRPTEGSHFNKGQQQTASIAVGQSNYPSELPTDSHQSFQPQAQYQYPYGTPQHAFASQFDMAQQPASGRGGPYNMSAMASALPQSGYRANSYPNGGSQQRFQNGATPSMMHQMPQVSPYVGQGGFPAPNQQYYVQQHPQIQQYYPGQQLPSSQPHGNAQSRQNIAYFQNQMVMGQSQPVPIHPGYYYTQPNQFPGQGHGIAHTLAAGFLQQPGQSDHQVASPTSATQGGIPYGHPGGMKLPGDGSVDGRQSIVRGPPRKPKQSGHAIWIGNLPPQTDLMALVAHVCKEAPGLESLFLISKSNCAFANFANESVCIAAQQKLHDSKFQTVRLVSRLRKSTVEGATGVTAPTGPAATSTTLGPSDGANQGVASDSGKASPVAGQAPDLKSNTSGDGTPQKDKFFILKSLTIEDLELSAQTGIWATQSHNEETLNNAFKAVDNVYLVFSANKSGEYFGYARMTSPINEDPAAAIEFAPKVQSTNDMDLPKAIPTEPTEFAPKGRIIDDSARGTIFWEADREDVEEAEEEESESTTSGKSLEADIDGSSKAWGKPFKLEWLSTSKLPFYRTRGLRNPWNSNREVKIARDGTELEPGVGRRLIGLFNRVQSPGPGHRAMMGYPPMQHYPQ